MEDKYITEEEYIELWESLKSRYLCNPYDSSCDSVKTPEQIELDKERHYNPPMPSSIRMIGSDGEQIIRPRK